MVAHEVNPYIPGVRSLPSSVVHTISLFCNVKVKTAAFECLMDGRVWKVAATSSQGGIHCMEPFA